MVRGLSEQAFFEDLLQLSVHGPVKILLIPDPVGIERQILLCSQFGAGSAPVVDDLLAAPLIPGIIALKQEAGQLGDGDAPLDPSVEGGNAALRYRFLSGQQLLAAVRGNATDISWIRFFDRFFSSDDQRPARRILP